MIPAEFIFVFVFNNHILSLLFMCEPALNDLQSVISQLLGPSRPLRTVWLERGVGLCISPQPLSSLYAERK